MHTALLKDVTDFLAETGMGEYRFGIKAVSNGRLLENLRKTRKNGLPSRVWPETEAKVRAFMIAERRRRSELPPPAASMHVAAPSQAGRA